MSFTDPYNIGITRTRTPETIMTYSPYQAAYGAGGAGFTDFSGVNTLGGIVGNVNALNIAGQQAANAARIPNAPGLEGQSSKMIADQLMGKLPSDVVSMLGRGAGENAVSRGMIGAPASEAAYRKALGLASIGQMEAGQRNLSAAYARNPGAKTMDAESQIITPLQQAQLDLERQRLAQSKSGGGGGGGGGYPRATGGDTGGYIPTAADLFGGYGRRGTIYSPEPAGGVPASYSFEDSPALEGFYPTSSGSMYMGSLEGYDPEFWNYTGTGWEDEFFGNYGG